MTVEIEYRVPTPPQEMGKWQLDMAKQIEDNQGFPIADLGRELSGSTFIVRVESETLPSTAIENMLSDIGDHLPPTASHVETREVD